MKKKLAIAAVVVVALLAAAAGWLWHMMGQPLYQPGMVRAEEGLGSPLQPPTQAVNGSEPFVVAEGIELHHFEHGTGPLVLVIHGGPGAAPTSTWRGLVELEESHRFLYYHQRGCGQSSRPFRQGDSSAGFMENMEQLNRTLGVAEQIADIERLRRILDEERLILLGHSFGAFLAALYAAEFPERVQALLLVSPAPLIEFPTDGGGLFEEIRRALPEARQAEYHEFLEDYLDFGSLFQQTDEQLARTNARLYPFYLEAARQRGVPVPESQGEETAESIGGFVVQGAFLSLGRSHDYSAALAAVTAPVLIIHGERDLQSEAGSRLYEGYFTSSTFRVIEGVGHFSFEENPAEFAQIAGQFLEQVATPQ